MKLAVSPEREFIAKQSGLSDGGGCWRITVFIRREKDVDTMFTKNAKSLTLILVDFCSLLSYVI